MQAIADAKAAGLDTLAFTIMELHHKLYPEDSLLDAYNRATLERFEAQRQLRDIEPERAVWSYETQTLDSARKSPSSAKLIYTRLGDGRTVRVYPNSPYSNLR